MTSRIFSKITFNYIKEFIKSHACEGNVRKKATKRLERLEKIMKKYPFFSVLELKNDEETRNLLSNLDKEKI